MKFRVNDGIFMKSFKSFRPGMQVCILVCLAIHENSPLENMLKCKHFFISRVRIEIIFLYDE